MAPPGSHEAAGLRERNAVPQKKEEKRSLFTGCAF